MRRHDQQPTLLRHGPEARIGHAVVALGMLALIVSGLGMAERMPAPVVSTLGGHVWLGGAHRWLGIGYGAAAVGLALFGPAVVRRLLREMCRFRRSEARWFRSFARYVLAPSRHRPLPHDGRFDPGQRVIFTAMLGSFAVLVVSAAALYLAPADATSLLAWSLRIHIAAAVVFIAALTVHVAVGTGLLASHRNIGRVIFGDGRIRPELARTLWPTWAAGLDAQGGPAAPPADRRPDAPAAETGRAGAERYLDQGGAE